MKVAVFGGRGFIGGHLVRELLRRGDEAVIVSRSAEAVNGAACVTWRNLEEDPSPLEGCTAFVNLAGATINTRWTAKAKQRILQSRLDAAARVAAIVRRLEHKPSVVLNGSGMSVYGYSETATFDETSPGNGDDFLASVVREWERAADDIGKIEGVRLVKLRIGLVLGRDGGAFPLMALPYKLGVGGKIGSGRQVHSWIHIRDMVGIMLHCMACDAISGPVNCTAPEPVTNEEFGRAVARALGRPHWFTVPSAVFRLAFGEMSEVLLKGQRVLPNIVRQNGYSFAFSTIDEALRDLLGKPERRV